MVLAISTVRTVASREEVSASRFLVLEGAEDHGSGFEASALALAGLTNVDGMVCEITEWSSTNSGQACYLSTGVLSARSRRL